MIRAPGPRGGVIWGLLPEFRCDPLGLLQRAATQHGDIARLRFGPVVAHLVNHPDLIEQVLSRHAVRYDKKTRSADRIAATCGQSLLSADGPAWQRHRRLIQPVFQPRNLGGLDQVVDAEITPLLERWQAISRAGGTIMPVAEMTRLAIGISAKALFSSDVDAVQVEAALAVLLDDTWRRLNALLDPAMIADTFHRPAFKRARAEIDRIMLQIIARRRTMTDPPADLLSLLIRAHEAEDEARLTDTELRDAAVTLLLSGHETTANALAWSMYLLGAHPDLGPQVVGADNFFAEVIRLYPSIWIVERRAIAEETIGGYTIPRGSSVLVSPYILHRRADFWPNPERFDPTRFKAESNRPRHAYLPFGLGPHRCVGLYIAKAIAARVIGKIDAAFRLQPLPDHQPQIFPGITLRHKCDFPMAITAR